MSSKDQEGVRRLMLFVCGFDGEKLRESPS